MVPVIFPFLHLLTNAQFLFATSKMFLYPTEVRTTTPKSAQKEGYYRPSITQNHTFNPAGKSESPGYLQLESRRIQEAPRCYADAGPEY